MFKNINIFKSILAILILFIPLYPKFPLFGVSDTYVAIRLDDIVVALGVLIWIIFQIKNKFPIFKTKTPNVKKQFDLTSPKERQEYFQYVRLFRKSLLN